MRLSSLAPLVLVLLPLPALAQDLQELLAKGPVVLMETDAKGRFSQATAIIAIEQPIEKVWAISTDFARFKDVMPKVVKSDVIEVAATESVKKAGQRQIDLTLEIEVPGSNPEYTFRYTIDDAKREMAGQWQSGDLKGSTTRWRLVPAGPSRTLLHYSAATKNFSAMAASLEDDQQTITVGVNVSAALATVKAVKRKAEAASEAPAK